MRQEQYLDVLALDEALRRWNEALGPQRPEPEPVPLADAHGRVLASAVLAPNDVPAFDRSNVDGFAVRARDTFGASEESPAALRLTGVPIDAGHAPTGEVGVGEARTIATGGVIPRGADAVVMVEDSQPGPDGHIQITAAATPGGRISMAGSDVCRGETILRAGTVLTARETGTLAACGIASLPCARRPRVAVLSTGDELVPPGTTLDEGQVHDANTTLVIDALRELGADASDAGIVGDDFDALSEALDQALGSADLVLLSGGTSKGGGDVCYRVIAERGRILAHGIALRPGKPLCLAVVDEKPVAILPGFPTSAIFTFHAAIAPMLRARLGVPPASARTVAARLPSRFRSVRGRTEFTLVHLIEGARGWVAVPLGKGSGSVTTFARADGFFVVPALTEQVEADTTVDVTLLGSSLEPADLVIMGSHCTGLDLVLRSLASWRVKVLSVGSRGGIDALERGACHIAPVHLYDAERAQWNEPFAPEGSTCVRGYGRTQVLAYRPEHAARFVEGSVETALAAAASDSTLRIANRNPGSGTRMLVDGVLGDATPAGWATTYRSHSAVAGAIAAGRADYGVCLAQAATARGLDARPWRDEHYDFLVAPTATDRPAVRDFLAAVQDPTTRAALEAAGFVV